MASTCFYFQVHQPRRIKKFRIFEIGSSQNYFDGQGENNLNNRRILRKVADKCYLPANQAIKEMLKKHRQFKCAFSLSGSALEQFEEYAPEVLASFQDLVKTGRVEILSETYYHSLAFLYSPQEFKRQVRLHQEKVKELFGIKPKVFRNTELIFSNQVASLVSELGYQAMLMEGADHLLGWRSPGFVYQSSSAPKLKLLLKHYRLSDDMAFRFGEKTWAEYPLTAPKFAQWVSAHNGSSQLINLFMDYETFGEHQWESTGIFNFLKALPAELLRHRDNDFVTPSEAVNRYQPVGEIDSPHYVSWADIERDLSAWRSNPMQHDALNAIYSLEKEILKSRDQSLIEDWRRLQTSDHFYYMCTKWFADGDVHAYFNPYQSPYEAYISFMNVLADLKLRLAKVSQPSVWHKLVDNLKSLFSYK